MGLRAGKGLDCFTANCPEKLLTQEDLVFLIYTCVCFEALGLFQQWVTGSA